MRQNINTGKRARRGKERGVQADVGAMEVLNTFALYGGDGEKKNSRPADVGKHYVSCLVELSLEAGN